MVVNSVRQGYPNDRSLEDGSMPIAARMIAAAAVGLLWACSAVSANDYPSRPIRIVVPYPAGGPSDTAARLLAEPLARELGQRVIVENRAGGSGLIGTEATIRADHDGYTLLVGGSATIVLLPVTKPGQYDPHKDLIPISQIWYSPQVLVSRSSLGFKSAADLVSFAKLNPAKLNFGSAGNGTVTHLGILLLAKEANISITHVPYRSTALWLNDAIADRIDGGFADVKTVLPHIEAKSITPLAVTAPARVAQLPDTQTIAEIGLPEVQTDNWFALMGLGRTPPAIIERLKTAVAAAQSDPAYRTALDKLGAMSGTPGPDALRTLIANDVRRFTPMIRAIGDKIE
jgi:tripartite-type tricarboxylate transporter receptor subunit TctC